MGKKKKDKRPDTLDGLTETYSEGYSVKDMDKTHKDLDKVAGEDALNDLKIRILSPAIDEWYTSFAKALDEHVGEDIGTKTKGKEKEIKRAAIAALKSYFTKANPNVLKGIEGMKDEDQIFDALKNHYHAHHGGAQRVQEKTEESFQEGGKGYIGLDQIIHMADSDKDMNVGKLKTMLMDQKGYHVELAVASFRSDAYGKKLGHLKGHHYDAYIKAKLADDGHPVDDPSKLHGMGIAQKRQFYHEREEGLIRHQMYGAKSTSKQKGKKK